MASTAAFGIICKTPIPGKSKTRMIPLLGAGGAAALAGCFLRDVAAGIESVPASLGRRGYAIYAPEGTEAEIRGYIPRDFGTLCRRDATLGVVLLGATEHLLAAGHDCAILINADSPTLPAQLLIDAIAAIRAPGPRVVLGPATDGGYYLIASKQPHPELFADIPWSTPQVLETTVARATAIGLPVTTLAPWYDVDDAETLGMLLDELRDGRLPFNASGRRGGPAHATRAFLARQPDFSTRLTPASVSSGAARR
jgi:uncharacterized protein